MIFLISILLGVCSVAVFCVVVTKYDILSKLYDVEIGESGIKFFIFRYFHFYTLNFNNIKEVIFSSGIGIKHPFAVDFRNRYFKGYFLLRKKRGFFTKEVLITPVSYSDFIDKLTSHGALVKNDGNAIDDGNHSN